MIKQTYLILAAASILAACSKDSSHQQAEVQKNTAVFEHIMLKGDQVLPESAGIDPSNGDLYVGSTYDGSVQKIHNHEISWFLPAEKNKSFSISGIAADPERNRLWVLNIDIQNPMSRKTGLRIFDLTTKALLKTFSIPNDKMPHGLNDIVLDKKGNAYISDCFSPVLWTVNSNMDHLEPFIQNESFTLDPKSFNLNGLAFTPNGNYLIATVANLSNGTLNNGEGHLFRIDIAKKELTKVNIKGYEGGDGITFGSDGALYSTTMPRGLAKVTFSNDYKNAKAIHPETKEIKNLSQYAPSAVRSYGDRIYLVNSQLDKTFPNSPTFKKPFAPFEITAIPVNKVK